MTEKILKPISDFERDLLSSLGETPEQHQRQMREKIASTSLKAANDTKRSLRELNSIFEKKRNSSLHEPIEALGKRLVSLSPAKTAPLSIDEALERGWKLSSLVLFVQELHCECKQVHLGLGITKPMLCFQHPRDSLTRIYFRCYAMSSYSNLPRVRETELERVESCPSCFNATIEITRPFIEESIHAPTEVRTLPQSGPLDSREASSGTLPPSPGPTDSRGSDEVRKLEQALPGPASAGLGGDQTPNQAECSTAGNIGEIL